MGQQCSCLQNEEENKIEKNLDLEREKVVSLSHQSSIKENLDNSFTQSKYQAKVKIVKTNSEKYSDNNKQVSISYDHTNYVKTDNTINNASNVVEKTSFEQPVTKREFDLVKVLKIVRNMQLWFYKKKFIENVRENLVEINDKIYRSLFNSENVKKLDELNSKCKEKYEIEGWKKYYKEFPFDLLKLNKNNSNSDKIDSKNGVTFESIFGKTYKSKKIFLGKNNKIDNEKEIKYLENTDNININLDNDINSNANDQIKKDVISFKDKNEKEKKNNIDNKKNYTYIGDVNRYNQKHGRGVLYYLDGTCREEGTWFEDQLIGWVRIIYSTGNGLVFEGIYLDNGFNGKGKIFSIDETTVYEGDLSNSKKHGFGIEITSEQKYEGHFIENKKKGKGKVYFTKSGDVFEGEFIDNKMHSGKYIWKDDGNIYEGSFLNNKMHGTGKYIWKDNGNVYEGEYKEGKKHGFGVIKENDKIIYEGQFLDGNPHGKGTRYDKKGVKIEVNMEHGKKVRDNASKNKSVSPKKIGLKQRILENKNAEGTN